ncbi:MAG: glutaminyl-peptide cyclotransferase [Verrucomicrobiales bacterium]|jgi:glutaminyl-peptide cyclotransferase
MSTKPFQIAIVLALASCGGGGGDSGPDYKYDSATAVHQNFSGEKAFAHVEKLVDFGPRPAGSPAIERSRVYLEEQLAALGWHTLRQGFPAEIPNGATVDFVNLRARFGDADNTTFWDQPRAILIGSHYDTKRIDHIKFVGANDGGSSTGALLEIARIAAANPELAGHLELVFFDGEEAVVRFSPTDGLYGSKHYARKRVRRQSESQRPKTVVILDMIGDEDLLVRVPSDTPKHLTEKLFAAAEELGTRKHFGIWGSKITDDHVPFQDEGIDAIDLIDFDFRAWHTSRDRMDQISAESLKISGQTAMLFVEKYLLGGE